MKLQGKTAIVTGAGSGIGRASAELFAREGAQVVVADLMREAAAETAKSIRESGGVVMSMAVDVSDVRQIQNMVSAASNAFGRLDIMYSNAGVPCAGGLEEVDETEYDRDMAVNLKASFYCARFASHEMKRAGGGSIIFTSSVAGMVGVPRSPLYCATKGGVSLLSKSLALALAPHNIRVNAICPGPIDTPLARQAFEKGGTIADGQAVDWGSAQAAMISMVPMGRRGKPEEVARAALFLASADSSFITGIDLPVDGGYTAR